MAEERDYTYVRDIVKQQKQEKDSLKELLFYSLVLNVFLAMAIVIG